MKNISISEFKAGCLGYIEHVRLTREPLEVTKRGKLVAIVNPPPLDSVDWTPGAFRDQTEILGDVEGDVEDLGIVWEALQ
jgi:hypothetical protein